MTDSTEEISQILKRWSDGDAEALDRLMPLVYDELRRLANHYLQRHQGITFQPTVMVHEVYIRLVSANGGDFSWQSRAQFFGLASHIMRQIFVDHVRTHYAAKRGGGRQNLSLSQAEGMWEQPEVDLLELDDALVALEKLDERQCRIVEMRFFGGLTVEEIAEVLNISPTTVKREWSLARAWLRRALSINADE